MKNNIMNKQQLIIILQLIATYNIRVDNLGKGLTVAQANDLIELISKAIDSKKVHKRDKPYNYIQLGVAFKNKYPELHKQITTDYTKVCNFKKNGSCKDCISNVCSQL